MVRTWSEIFISCCCFGIQEKSSAAFLLGKARLLMVFIFSRTHFGMKILVRVTSDVTMTTKI